MACNNVNQSALAEVRDQLFLDTADGARLDIVTSNLGLDRPLLTMGDDEWRAAAKAIALQPKLIEWAFRRLIEICIGPQFARIGTLEEAIISGVQELTVLNGAPYVQTGTLVIDPLLPTEETVKFCIRDAITGVFELSTALTQPHAVIPPGSSFLSVDASAGATSLVLRNSSLLPASGFPYPVMIDQGTPIEELVKVTGNNTGTNTLTVTATAFDHKSPQSGPVIKPLAYAAPVGRTFVRLATNATRVFPEAGWLRINHGGGADEVVEFVANDVVMSTLSLRTPLLNSHVVGQGVELVTSGAPVSVAQVVQLGVHWILSIPSPRNVEVTIPENLKPLSPLDATWMHDVVPGAFSTTLAAAANAADQYLRLTSVSGMQREAGMVQIALSQIVFYDRVLAQADLATTNQTTVIGAKSIAYVRTGEDDFDHVRSPFAVIIDPGGPNQEVATVIDAATDVERLIFSPALTVVHAPGETIRVLNQVLLPSPVGTNYAGGTAVALYRTPYAGTLLDDGNIRGAFPYTLRLYHYAGGYIFDPSERGVSAVSTTLSVQIPPTTRMAFSQLGGRTNLEVVDASLWPAPPFTPFSARIGAGAGYQEDQLVVDRTLQTDATATCSSATAPGTTLLPYTLTSAGEFPESDGITPAGYRIRINRGGPRDETIVIDQNDIGTPQFTLFTATTLAHNIGDTIELIHDVITVGVLAGPHAGPSFTPTVLGELVQPLITEIDMVALPAGFPVTGGFAWINFGKEIIDQRKRIASITNATHYVLSSTALFPTSGYPYQVILGDGTLNEERVFVTNNNTGTNTLTFAAPGALKTHAVAQYVRFFSGEPEVVEFTTTQTSPTNALIIDPPLVLESGHLVGERVIYSPAVSASRADGSSFGFKLPPDPTACVTALLELVRAAGVRVDVVQR